MTLTCVPTGMNTGVSTSPWRKVRQPTLAFVVPHSAITLYVKGGGLILLLIPDKPRTTNDIDAFDAEVARLRLCVMIQIHSFWHFDWHMLRNAIYREDRRKIQGILEMVLELTLNCTSPSPSQLAVRWWVGCIQCRLCWCFFLSLPLFRVFLIRSTFLHWVKTRQTDWTTEVMQKCWKSYEYEFM